ncbi:MarR family winged helix-turn-helix transcriptional regulator [Flexivirga alba]|uniref:MarR family winged helix-turn-helix transcriptional regulator n=1 Tax=Flexivirga alba TaxID=702742 RepID=A0ABW2AAN9_9MICO
MAESRRDRPPPIDERWAELADHILVIAREIQFRDYQDEQAVPLTQSEGMVMRYLNQNNDASPSRIAAATGLQRTNLSTVLRGLAQKGLIERQARPADGRGVTVVTTARGRDNYHLVRQEWAQLLEQDGTKASRLNTALELLRSIEAGLVSTRPGTPASRPGV